MNPDIEQQLREAITKSGLSHAELGKATGISQPTISRFVRGDSTLKLHNASSLCRRLGLRLVSGKKKDAP